VQKNGAQTKFGVAAPDPRLGKQEMERVEQLRRRCHQAMSPGDVTRRCHQAMILVPYAISSGVATVISYSCPASTALLRSLQAKHSMPLRVEPSSRASHPANATAAHRRLQLAINAALGDDYQVDWLGPSSAKGLHILLLQHAVRSAQRRSCSTTSTPANAYR
jgi:hypothetical protein